MSASETLVPASTTRLHLAACGAPVRKPKHRDPEHQASIASTNAMCTSISVLRYRPREPACVAIVASHSGAISSSSRSISSSSSRPRKSCGCVGFQAIAAFVSPVLVGSRVPCRMPHGAAQRSASSRAGHIGRWRPRPVPSHECMRSAVTGCKVGSEQREVTHPLREVGRELPTALRLEDLEALLPGGLLRFELPHGVAVQTPDRSTGAASG